MQQLRNTRTVDALVARIDTPSSDGRTIRRVSNTGVTVPVIGFNGPPGGRREPNLVGSATVEATDEGLVAHLAVTAGTAARLLAREVHATLDVRDADIIVEDGLAVLHGGSVAALHVGAGVPPWSDLWVREA